MTVPAGQADQPVLPPPPPVPADVIPAPKRPPARRATPAAGTEQANLFHLPAPSAPPRPRSTEGPDLKVVKGYSVAAS